MDKQDIINKIEAYVDYSSALFEGLNEGLITRKEFNFFFGIKEES